MRIRSIIASDKEAWLKHWNAYLDFYRADIVEDTTEHTWQSIISEEGPHGAFVAELENEIVGFVIYLPHASSWSKGGYIYLEDLFVAPETRGKGVGKALIDQVNAQADKIGASRVYWITNADNLTAQKLYDGIAEKSDVIQYRSNRPCQK